jgi:glutathione S-transferase
MCQVPAVAYGGSDVPPDQPSPESAKIAESLVLIQFFADLAPKSDLLPQDALGKARVRFFLDAVSNKIQPNLSKWANGSGSYDAFFEALDAIQDQLPPVGKGKYIFGDKFTLADIAIAPFLGRALLIQLKDGLGKFDKEEAKRGWEHFQGPKYERVRQYIDDIVARPSWKSTFDEVCGNIYMKLTHSLHYFLSLGLPHQGNRRTVCVNGSV